MTHAEGAERRQKNGVRRNQATAALPNGARSREAVGSLHLRLSERGRNGGSLLDFSRLGLGDAHVCSGVGGESCDDGRVKAQAIRWVRARGLDVSKKPNWQVEISLVTTGELPKRVRSGREPFFWVQISDAGWWMILEYPFPGARGVERTAEYVSWNKPEHRWHLGFQSSRSLDKKPRERSVDKFEPPKSLENILRWLEPVESRLGFTFRRDRPLITSNVKGGAKAAFAWLVA